VSLADLGNDTDELMLPSRHPVLRFAMGPAAIALAMLTRLFLWPFIHHEVPFLLLWPAVIASAWFGGFASGLLATVFAALAEVYFVLDPRFSFNVASSGELLGTALFVVLGSTASLLTAMLHRAQQDLRQEFERKDVFLTTLAHELRNPLTPIRNALSILRLTAPSDPRLTEMTALIDRQVHQISRLVDDLLDLSRIGQGKIRLVRESVDLLALAGQAVEMSRPLMDSRHQCLKVLLPPEPIRLYADPSRLVQVMVNLLNNAAKYTDEGGTIWLSVQRRGNEAVVKVRDTGVGISPEMLAQVFELFTQVEEARGRSQGGLGVGLALVRGLVELHGGTVEAHSEGSGKGSEFVVRLPITPKCDLEPEQVAMASPHHQPTA